jgi:ribosomal protein S24E
MLVDMDLKILTEEENKFFNRKELKIELKHPNAATPTKVALLKELVTKYSAPEENILIDYIYTKKGSNESFAKVKIYKEKPKIKVKEKKEKPKPEETEKPKEEEKSEAQTSEAK